MTLDLFTAPAPEPPCEVDSRVLWYSHPVNLWPKSGRCVGHDMEAQEAIVRRKHYTIRVPWKQIEFRGQRP